MTKRYPVSPEVRERNSQAARKKVAFNETLTCSCKGCHEDRYRLYKYCFKHTRRSTKMGHPDGRVPTKEDLKALDAVLIQWFEGHYDTADKRREFHTQWGNAQRSLSKPQSYAKSYHFFTGQMRLTREDKAAYFLAGYQHRKGRSFSPALIRWMSARLFAELCFEMPAGKTNFTKERRLYYNLIAGKFVFFNSGYTSTTSEQIVVGWEKSILAPPVGHAPTMLPITETKTKQRSIDFVKSAATIRVVGWHLERAVSDNLGTSWLQDHNLLKSAKDALGIPY